MSHHGATLSGMGIADFVDPLAMSWISPTRYYVAQIRTNLFGELEFFRAWGGRGSRRGGHKAEPLMSIDEGRDRLSKEDVRRSRRGYVRQN
jgi:WGR domain